MKKITLFYGLTLLLTLSLNTWSQDKALAETIENGQINLDNILFFQRTFANQIIFLINLDVTQ